MLSVSELLSFTSAGDHSREEPATENVAHVCLGYTQSWLPQGDEGDGGETSMSMDSPLQMDRVDFSLPMCCFISECRRIWSGDGGRGGRPVWSLNFFGDLVPSRVGPETGP